MSLPYLYSLQHCPYAMRARLGILLSNEQVWVRAIKLNNKPEAFLAIAKKGTVPILILDDRQGPDHAVVVDESLDIMLWALKNSDPQNLLYSDNPNALPEMLTLIERFERDFVEVLEKYKYAGRFRDFSQLFYRRQCELFIQELEQRLDQHDYFMGPTPSLMDYALLPFIRQFAKVERQWYMQSPYVNVRDWLNRHLQQPLFTKAMAKFPLWVENEEAFLLGA